MSKVFVNHHILKANTPRRFYWEIVFLPRPRNSGQYFEPLNARMFHVHQLQQRDYATIIQFLFLLIVYLDLFY